ncbi:MAG TPA: hypothetical protein VMG12_23100 [Polyangiaceae bacterium]|nr:hypothetical protein [Polyangiaceae bacterium]
MNRRPGLSGVPDLIESRAVGPRIVQTTISGYATQERSVLGLRQFVSIIAAMDRPVWVSDSSNLTGYERASIKYGSHWFSEFRRRGGSRVVVVSDWGIAMMAARAMGLGFGVRLDNAPTLREALQLAEQAAAER